MHLDLELGTQGVIDNASRVNDSEASVAEKRSTSRILLVFGSRSALTKILPSLGRHAEQLVLVEDDCELAEVVAVDKSDVRAMLEVIGSRRPTSSASCPTQANVPHHMREFILCLVFAATSLALALTGSPILVALAFVLAMAAYSSLMGIAKRSSAAPTPPLWATIANSVRECLANEPERTESF